MKGRWEDSQKNAKKITCNQVYEPEPGRETPEEKRLREVNIEVELTNTINKY